MNNPSSGHMMDKPYVKDVIRELKLLGYEKDEATKILVKYYRPLKRSLGFGPNAYNFAKEIDSIHKAVIKKNDPSEPKQIYIGHLKNRIKSNLKDKL
ncbi:MULTISPECIES: hypothetical protein [Paenibacillus]|uniref:hypothetical protein n=1 Tax=Paenibacillus TaxID=44249 RepID=UPI00096E1ADA|nr:hypothetical protein [Paenibacillus odorifer]OME08688.1 hypothetical protein BSK60_29640 [Paenibacillus odorifer]